MEETIQVSDDGLSVAEFDLYRTTGADVAGIQSSAREDRSFDDPTMDAALRSLCFPDMDNRFHDIALACVHTCDWVSQSTQFRKWIERQDLRNHNGILWIKGKPGAGKSTMIKHALITVNGCNGSPLLPPTSSMLVEVCLRRLVLVCFNLCYISYSMVYRI